jgi:hypothetical protein
MIAQRCANESLSAQIYVDTAMAHKVSHKTCYITGDFAWIKLQQFTWVQFVLQCQTFQTFPILSHVIFTLRIISLSL